MEKETALAVIKRYINLDNQDDGIPIEKLFNGIEFTERDSFMEIMDHLQRDNIIRIIHDCIFIGPCYEQNIVQPIDKHSAFTITGCQITGPLQIGNENTQNFTNQDIDKLLMLIETLAKKQDTTIVESVLNIIKKAEDTYKKLRDLLKLKID